MHYLRKYILDRLRFEQPLSYSQMLPGDIESSLFQYHLKALLTDGLIEKTGRGIYELTGKGYVRLEYMSVNQHNEVRMPKAITFTLLTYRGDMLLYRKPKEPYRHLLELIGGKIHFGEKAEDAARRDVKEKAHLSIESPRFCGVANVMVHGGEVVLTHMIVYVFAAEVDDISFLSEHMVRVSDIRTCDDLAPSTLPIFSAIQEHTSPFSIELDLLYKSNQ